MAAVVEDIMGGDRRRTLRVGRIATLVLAVLVALTTVALALSTPARNGWVTDEAGILDADTANALATRLIDLQRKTGDEVIVVTLSGLQGASIETWGNVLGESWNVGKAGGGDKGVLLIVAPNDRQVRIAVGYGLGNRISDSTAAAIIGDHILPYFRSGDFTAGIKAGVESIALQLDSSGAASTVNVERGAEPIRTSLSALWSRWKPSASTLKTLIWVGVVIVVLFFVASVSPSGGYRRRWDDDDDYNSTWGNNNRSSYRGSSWSSSNSSSGGRSSWSSSSSSSGGSSHSSFGGGATGKW